MFTYLLAYKNFLICVAFLLMLSFSVFLFLSFSVFVYSLLVPDDLLKYNVTSQFALSAIRNFK